MSKWNVRVAIEVSKAGDSTANYQTYGVAIVNEDDVVETYDADIPGNTREDALDGAQRLLDAIAGS